MSPLYGRAIFIVATRETGAERLLAALGALPAVVAAPVPTHLFARAIDVVVDHWVTVHDTEREHGLHGLAGEQPFLGAVRLLADGPLAALLAAARAERVVEHSPDHIMRLDLLAQLYPDAHIVHVVRDGRRVAARLASSAHPREHRLPDAAATYMPIAGAPARTAARRWCDDQRAALESRHPNVHVVRMEDLLEAPHATVRGLAGRLGLHVSDDATDAAVRALGVRDAPPEPRAWRPRALVELLGPDVLAHFGYTPEETVPHLRAAKVELRVDDSIAGGLERLHSFTTRMQEEARAQAAVKEQAT